MTSHKFQATRRRALAAVAAGGSSTLVPGLAGAQSESRYGIEGQLAPELELDYWIDANGDPGSFSVAASRGKWVLLKCFQDWCPGCHSSGFPSLQAFSNAFHDHPAVAIAAIQTVFEGFSTNTVEDVRKLQTKYALPIMMGHDPGDPEGDHRPQTMRKYRTGGTPWMIVIDPDGQVVYNHYHINHDKLIEFIRSQVG